MVLVFLRTCAFALSTLESCSCLGPESEGEERRGEERRGEERRGEEMR
jgi:hypothetical protein